MIPTAIVTPRGEERARIGHPWIYRSDVVDAAAVAPGDLVRVTDGRRPIGWAFWSSASQIALRCVSRDTRDRAPDERELFTERLRAAAAYRATLEIDASACRLVHAESDGLPGLIVDRYTDENGPYLVVQTLTESTNRRLPFIVELLVDLWAPRGVLARNDPGVRRLEGLESQVEVLFGEVPTEVRIREGQAVMAVNLHAGQKTGAFLDQRENHQAAAALSRGRVLDAFTYNGGFALQMAPRAEYVLAVDSSAPAVAATAANAALNGLTNIEVREANVFDELRELETGGVTFDVVVLDPPAFARNRAAVPRALAGYKEINLRAMRLLAPGGHLVTCSCSYNVAEDVFLSVIADAAADAHVSLSIVEKRLQARDHPVLLTVPETYYLKCIVLRRM
jgi:23S rRNA (cytosine1962-C5)-methyltransferase